MFIGHFAVGFAAKPAAPRVSLGMLFLACQLADLLWPTLVLTGVETVEIDPGNTVLTPLDFSYYPWSHSLVGMMLWGTALAVLYRLIAHARWSSALVLAAVVLSHWLLDVLTHGPDMPVTLGNTPLVGAGLWNHPVPAIVVELLLFGVGAWLYARSTRALDRIGSIGLWSLVVFLLLVHVANVVGPPPPSAAAVAWSAQAMWLIVAWGFWVDRHRVSLSGG